MQNLDWTERYCLASTGSDSDGSGVIFLFPLSRPKDRILSVSFADKSKACPTCCEVEDGGISDVLRTGPGQRVRAVVSFHGSLSLRA